jgi:hypothetical protein
LQVVALVLVLMGRVAAQGVIWHLLMPLRWQLLQVKPTQ